MARFDCFFRYTGNTGEMFGGSFSGTGVALLIDGKKKHISDPEWNVRKHGRD